MLYAAYGSNLHPVRLSLRLPGSRFLGTATIAGWKLLFHKRSLDRSAKCAIFAGQDSIHVAVYEINEQEKAVLDGIEGVGSGYSVETLDVPGFGDCFTYIATSSHIDDRLRPYSWYKELVAVGCEALGFPVDYVATIQSIAAIDDPDRERHATNTRLIERARKSAYGAFIKGT